MSLKSNDCRYVRTGGQRIHQGGVIRPGREATGATEWILDEACKEDGE